MSELIDPEPLMDGSYEDEAPAEEDRTLEYIERWTSEEIIAHMRDPRPIIDDRASD